MCINKSFTKKMHVHDCMNPKYMYIYNQPLHVLKIVASDIHIKFFQMKH